MAAAWTLLGVLGGCACREGVCCFSFGLSLRMVVGGSGVGLLGLVRVALGWGACVIVVVVGFGGCGVGLFRVGGRCGCGSRVFGLGAVVCGLVVGYGFGCVCACSVAGGRLHGGCGLLLLVTGQLCTLY